MSEPRSRLPLQRELVYRSIRRRVSAGDWEPRAPQILQVGLIPEVYRYILEQLVDRNWESMVIEGSPGGFITSDSPLVWGSLDEALSEREMTASLMDSQLEITFPVTKRVALVSYPDARMGNCTATDTVTGHINSRTHFMSMSVTFHAEPNFLLGRAGGIGQASDYFDYVRQERAAGNPRP